jgi:hypothetical protein
MPTPVDPGTTGLIVKRFIRQLSANPFAKRRSHGMTCRSRPQQ